MLRLPSTTHCKHTDGSVCNSVTSSAPSPRRSYEEMPIHPSIQGRGGEGSECECECERKARYLPTLLLPCLPTLSLLCDRYRHAAVAAALLSIVLRPNNFLPPIPSLPFFYLPFFYLSFPSSSTLSLPRFTSRTSERDTPPPLPPSPSLSSPSPSWNTSLSLSLRLHTSPRSYQRGSTPRRQLEIHSRYDCAESTLLSLSLSPSLTLAHAPALSHSA
ncbi:hypothetical protein LY76DRAFT_240396 [Colletotrichum caudatum]|nr:hypothetical protein LY76DRAFT_240396 [Colletotrichum caudatum]